MQQINGLFTSLLNVGVGVGVTVAAFFLMWGAFMYMSASCSPRQMETGKAAMINADPATLPPLTTWYLATNLPRPGPPHANEAPFAPADLAEIVRLYGLRNWVEQGYKQLKQELGWADFMVRADQAIRRHWHLVFCAFSFCWRAWFAATGPPANDMPPSNTADTGPPIDSGTISAPARGKMASARTGLPHPVSWPQTLRRVRGWLDPWMYLWCCWHNWSNAPPPPELLALLDSVAHGRPLNLFRRS